MVSQRCSHQLRIILRQCRVQVRDHVLFRREVLGRIPRFYSCLSIIVCSVFFGEGSSGRAWDGGFEDRGIIVVHANRSF